MLRILSDIHYGERSSRVRSLSQLRPLVDEASALVLNGDTLDTRPGPDPDRTARQRTEVREFFSGLGAETTFLTGNHDPDISERHLLDLAEGAVFVVHGDVLFRSIVPWGRDAALITARVRQELAALPPEPGQRLEDRLRAFRRAAAGVRQRHQAERNGLKYILGLSFDTFWPPWRAANIFHAWRVLPGRAVALARRHRPKARFTIVGHTHRPGVWRWADGRVVVNTGSFCRPLGACLVDLTAGRITVRRVESRRGEFRAGALVAEFALAPGAGLGDT